MDDEAHIDINWTCAETARIPRLRSMPCLPHVYGSHLPRPQYSPVRWLKLCWKIWFWIVAEKINTVSAEKTSRLRGKPIVCVLHHRRTCNDAHFPCPKLIRTVTGWTISFAYCLWCVVCAIVSVAIIRDRNLVFAFIVCDLVLVIKWRGASWDGSWWPINAYLQQRNSWIKKLKRNCWTEKKCFPRGKI